jgi:hypothetical protein
MSQFGLKVADRRLTLGQTFRALSFRDLLPQSLPRRIELVGGISASGGTTSNRIEHSTVDQNNIRPPTTKSVAARTDRKTQSGIWTAR